MKKFRVEAMSNESYNNYMCGGYNYYTEVIEVEANNEEEAIKNAKNILGVDYVINTNYVLAVEEYERIKAEEEAKWEAKRKAEEEKKARAKAKKEAKELAEAEAKGLTMEGLKAIKAKELKIKRAKKELEEALELVEKIKARIKRLEEDK